MEGETALKRVSLLPGEEKIIFLCFFSHAFSQSAVSLHSQLSDSNQSEEQSRGGKISCNLLFLSFHT